MRQKHVEVKVDFSIEVVLFWDLERNVRNNHSLYFQPQQRVGDMIVADWDHRSSFGG